MDGQRNSVCGSQRRKSLVKLGNRIFRNSRSCPNFDTQKGRSPLLRVGLYYNPSKSEGPWNPSLGRSKVEPGSREV